MTKYFKKFNTHEEYEAYITSESKILPNVSVCVINKHVHYNPRTKSVTGVTLNKSSLSLNQGASETLIATVLPSTASNKQVTWSSSDSNVATVDSNGKVTAVGGGNAVIIVTTVDGGFTAQCATSVAVSVTGVTLNKSSLSLNVGTSETLVATVLPSTASNKQVTWSSSDSSVATVDSNGKVTAVGSGNATMTVTTVDGGFTAQCSVNIATEYVEIGNVKWALKNVGATGITDTGLYFQWGDIQGYTAAQVGSGSGQKYFGWADYKYGNGSVFTKYDSNDGKTVLETSDDAANFNMGSRWRMPTMGDFQALSAATTSVWVDNYQGSGVSGRLFTGKQGTVDEGKTLFFPICGVANAGNVDSADRVGYYYSSSRYSGSISDGSLLMFFGNVCTITHINRCEGCNIRGVLV